MWIYIPVDLNLNAREAMCVIIEHVIEPESALVHSSVSQHDCSN